MSADNWRECPYCVEAAKDAWGEEVAKVAEAYGKVSAEEFLAMREAIDAGPPPVPESFREDYGFWVDGFVVKASYSGHCKDCGAGCDFDAEHPINPEVVQ